MAANSIQLLEIPRDGPGVTPISPIASTTPVRQPELLHQPRHRYESPRALESSSDNRTDARRSWRRTFKMRSFYVWPFSILASKRSQIPDDRDSKLVPKKLEKYPEGFPRIAAYIDSDVDTALFRRFGRFHARILLYMEVELNELEKKLDELDKKDNADEDTEWRIGHGIHHKDGRKNEERKSLIEEGDKKLKAYYDRLLLEAKIRKLPRPSERIHRNFMDYVVTENPFVESDQEFIYHEHDFISLEEIEESWLDQLMHRLMGHAKSGILRKIFVTPADRVKTEDVQHVHYYSASRLGVLIKIIIAVASTALLLIPIYIFSSVPLSTRAMASITLTFAFAFATAISLCTSARRQEVFGATAAYCAVLVVFIGNLQQKHLSP